MPKALTKRCQNCIGCRVPACLKCSNCSNKKACLNKTCTGGDGKKVNDEFNHLANFLEIDVVNEEKILALEMLLRLKVDFNILQSTEASRVGTLLRILRPEEGQVGIMASSVLEKWKGVGWNGWNDFLNTPQNTDSDTDCSTTPPQYGSNTATSVIKESNLNVEEQGEKSKGNLFKGGPKNLREQKVISNANYIKLISRVLENKKIIYKCKCGFQSKTRAKAARHANHCGTKKGITKKKMKKKMKKKQCNICGFLAINSKEMNSHKKGEHPNIDDSYKCRFPNCTSVFNSIKNYRQHIKIHQNDNFKCPFCPNKFNQAGSRNRHIFSKHKEALDLHAQEDSRLSEDLDLIDRQKSGAKLEPKIKRALVSRILKSIFQNLNGNVKSDDEKATVDEKTTVESDSDQEKSEEDEENGEKISKVSETIANEQEDQIKDVFKDYMCCESDTKGSEENFYEKIRMNNIRERYEKYKSLGLQDIIEEEKESRKSKAPRKNKADCLKLPTRKSKRLRGLLENQVDFQDLLVLAPEIEDYVNSAEPTPVRRLKELSKSMRSKPMPSIKILVEDTLPPLPIRFNSCVPIHPVEDITNPENTILPLTPPHRSLFGVASEIDIQFPLMSQRPLLQISADFSRDQTSPDSTNAELGLQVPEALTGELNNASLGGASSTSEGTDHEERHDGSSSEWSEDDSGGRFSCQLCPFNTAADNKDLRRHVSTMHSKLSKPVSCSKFWCQKEFDTKYDLKKHKEKCKELPCPEEGCNFIFKWKHQVESHKRYHKVQNEKSF